MVLYEAAPKGTKELMESMVAVLRIEESALKKMLDERGIVYTDRIEIAKNKASIMQLPY